MNKEMTARQVALAVLRKFDPRRTVVREMLSGLLERTTQRAAATELVMGIVRHTPTLDLVIERSADVQARRIEPMLLDILRLGVYELVFMPDQADYGIIDAAVESAKRGRTAKRAGFVNAVLRSVQRKIENRRAGISSENAARIIPQDDRNGCLFNFDLLADPKQDNAGYLAQSFAIPQWLCTDWIARFGFDEARSICLASNRRPSTFLRPNPLKTSAEELVSLLKSHGIDCELIQAGVASTAQQSMGSKGLIQDSAMIMISDSGAIANLPGYSEGLFFVQDLTASCAVRALELKENEVVLDFCSAPGGKTTQLAEIMRDRGVVLATDIDSKRLVRVEENKKRLALNSITIFEIKDLDSILSRLGRPDAVLLDVPCSNTGVLARRPEVRYRITKSAIEELAKVQISLLEKAAGIVKQGGRICYSTCSIEDEENSGVIASFLKGNTGFRIAAEKLTLPSAGSPDRDGGYYAVLT